MSGVTPFRVGRPQLHYSGHDGRLGAKRSIKRLERSIPINRSRVNSLQVCAVSDFDKANGLNFLYGS